MYLGYNRTTLSLGRHAMDTSYSLLSHYERNPTVTVGIPLNWLTIISFGVP